MNLPTPDPSQEGNCRCASAVLFPSWEGSGVGSRFRCAVTKPWRLARAKKFLLATCALLAFRAEPVFACAACYGQSDSPLAQAMNWGIFSLLGIVVSVLAGITTFFVVISRKSASVRAVESDESQTKKD